MSNLPNQIYNVDEKGMPLDLRATKIVAGRGHKKYDIEHLATRIRSLVTAYQKVIGNI